jgi:excisionase family DNA binding protein
VAEYLSLGAGKSGAAVVRQMVHRREIPHSRIGHRLRFDVIEIDKWIAANKVAAEDAAGGGSAA